MRLIDADALRKRWENQLPNFSASDAWTNGVKMAVIACMEDLEAQPTVDAVPVVHGKWEANCVCSECGFNRQMTRSGNYMVGKYCPNCGAKMDGGTK